MRSRIFTFLTCAAFLTVSFTAGPAVGQGISVGEVLSEVLTRQFRLGVIFGVDRHTSRWASSFPREMKQEFVDAIRQSLDRFDQSVDRIDKKMSAHVERLHANLTDVIAESSCFVAGTRSHIERTVEGIFSVGGRRAGDVTFINDKIVKVRSNLSLTSTPLAVISAYGDVSSDAVRTMCSIPEVRRLASDPWPLEPSRKPRGRHLSHL